jgi:Zn-dependent protease with chaperone function
MAPTARHSALVERLQVEARNAPRRYRCKLALLALAGYAVLVALLAVALGVPLLLVARTVSGAATADPSLAFAILMPGVFGALLLRALWVPFGVPPGYRLAAGEAPALEDAVARMRVAVGAPALNGIIIDGELNAAAVDLPRALGLLGHRHYLVLGLPLMQLLDRDELASVIAHEFGHFGAGHGRFSGWIYRLRLSWHRALDALSQRGGAMTLLLLRFYGWYVPYFNAYSFVLARHQEYEADAAAARAAGADAAASALLRMELASRRVQAGFRPALLERARMQGHPPAQVHADLARALRDPRPCDPGRLRALAARDADPDDTHPTLPQRLDAIGAASAPRPLSDTSAAQALLGARLPDIERRLDAQWREEIRAQWRERYDGAAADRARLAELEARDARTADESLQHARLIESLRIGFDALPLYERVLEATPDNALAHHRAGLLRLRRGEYAAGVEHLRRAMTRDPGAIRPVLADLERFERDPDLDPATVAALAELRTSFAPRARALDARDAVAGKDEFIAHDLDDEALGRLVATFAHNPRVAAAWLVRKRIDLAQEPAHYVILLDWRGSVASETAGLKQLSDAFDLPGSHTTVFTGSGHRDAARRVRALCGQPVYRKGVGVRA